jgi:hypothetical protein
MTVRLCLRYENILVLNKYWDNIETGLFFYIHWKIFLLSITIINNIKQGDVKIF